MVVRGWYPDPWGRAPLRWWDGSGWTGAVHPPGGETEIDVLTTGGVLDSLLRGAERIAVIDVETTGLYSADRVVEIAVVTMDRRGEVVDEFESLINPLRDPGPTWLHGLTPSMLSAAPVFEDVAFHVASLLDGAVVAAHNLSFDSRLLGGEFDRAGVEIDWGFGLDTLRDAQRKMKPETLQTPEILREIRNPEHKKDVVSSLKTEVSMRFAFSFACVTLGLIGVPLGITAQRRETSVGFALSLLVGIAYFLLMTIVEMMRENNSIRPYYLAWLPNLLFIGLGVYLFRRLAKK